jgi:hypothetical protein
LNDEVGSVDPRPGSQVTLHWAAEHSYLIGVAGKLDMANAERGRLASAAQD